MSEEIKQEIRDNYFRPYIVTPPNPLFVAPTFTNCTLAKPDGTIVGRWDENGEFHKVETDK